jgi:hypothetical protein
MRRLSLTNISIQRRVDKLKLAIAILICAVSVAATTRPRSSPHRNSRHRHHARRAHHVVEAQPVVDAIFTPATFAPEVLALPPIAWYHEGSLAVEAQDATLGDILQSIHESTGALIDAPVLDERVSVQLGPRPPAQAIVGLLEGTHLNYVILGGTSDQDRLLHIIVTPKTAASSEFGSAALDKPAAEARTRALNRFSEETGGDEGVWGDGPQAPREAPYSSIPHVSARH